MAVLPEDDTYPAGIYRIETTDPVLGGAPNEGTKAGLANIPTMQLAKRTHWLKSRVDQLLGKCVAATTSVAGLVTLSTSTNSTAIDRAATPSAVKAAYDLADGAARKTTKINTAGLATGGGPLSDDRTVMVREASYAEAVAGQVSDAAMTPRRVAQAHGYHGLGASPRLCNDLNAEQTTGWVRYSSETANRPTGVGTVGLVQIVSMAEGRTVQILWPTNGSDQPAALIRFAGSTGWGQWSECYNGTNLATAFPAQLGDTGWQRLPSGLMLQWGRSSVNASANGEVQITFPVAFPQYCCGVIGTDISNVNNKSTVGVADLTTTGARLTWALVTGTSHRGIRWIAIGY